VASAAKRDPPIELLGCSARVVVGVVRLQPARQQL